MLDPLQTAVAQAYPRRCGEHSRSTATRRSFWGLPPQVRGAPIMSTASKSGSRLTPAGAGSTQFSVVSICQRWAYPRRCGEHNSMYLLTHCRVGLPPQVRGALGTIVKEVWETGLTPAGAGSTDKEWTVKLSGRAYPRRCGEHSSRSSHSTRCAGLPPQVRGALDAETRRHVDVGLTPAGAGSTTSPVATPTSSRAYPRRCGEHACSITRCLEGSGLPPQVRGAQLVQDGHRHPFGLTPAGAGSTAKFSRARSMVGAYPRRCGEHSLLIVRRETSVGLPPQVRGAHGCQTLPGTGTGLTPAGAGST